MAAIGVHYLLELFDCPFEKLDDASFVTSTLQRAAEVARSTLLEEVSHRFSPQGVTALALLAESHISIHTWPENRYAAADIFTCGETADPEKACELLVEAFEAQEHAVMRVTRGVRVTNKGRTQEPQQVEEAPCPVPRFAPISG